MAEEGRKHPLLALDDADLEFVLQFVVVAGSLKELAQFYGVSYPTIRGKLNRLIARLQSLVQGRPADPMAELLADLVDKGQLPTQAARTILELHRRQCQSAKET